MAVPFLLASRLLGGFGGLAFSIASVSLRQAVTPERVLGRMNSVMMFVGFSGVPLGSLAGGVLASQIRLRGAIWVGAAGALLTFVPVLVSPVRRLRAIPSEGSERPLTPVPAEG